MALNILIGIMCVMLLQGCNYFAVAGGFVVSLYGAEKHGKRPRLLDVGRTEAAVVGGMLERVEDAGFAFVNQCFVVEEIPQTKQSVGIVGSLLVAPPAGAVVFSLCAGWSRFWCLQDRRGVQGDC